MIHCDNISVIMQLQKRDLSARASHVHSHQPGIRLRRDRRRRHCRSAHSHDAEPNQHVHNGREPRPTPHISHHPLGSRPLDSRLSNKRLASIEKLRLTCADRTLRSLRGSTKFHQATHNSRLQSNGTPHHSTERQLHPETWILPERTSMNPPSGGFSAEIFPQRVESNSKVG